MIAENVKGLLMGNAIDYVRRIYKDFEDAGYYCQRHYKIFCVNGNTGFRKEFRIFYFIHLQNEEDYERKESSSA